MNGRATGMSSGKIEFRAMLEPSDGWVCLVLPKGVSEKLGSRARVPIVGTINRFPIRTSVFPRGDGMHFTMVNKAMQEGAGVRLGDRVTVVLEVDAAPRVATVPADLRRALARSKKAKAAFERLSYTHRKEHVGWIEEAKSPETRRRRIEETIARLARGERSLRGM